MKQLLSTFTILLSLCILSRSQILNFHCDFDTNLDGDCLFTATNGGNKITLDQGPNPTGKPKQPLSDAKSVISLTDPDNQPCNFPYKYGGADLYFCRRSLNGTYSCPTDAGVGRCKADHSYTAKVTKSTSTTQCFDFYYYITEATGNAKIEVSWEGSEDLDVIVTVEADPAENKWQHSRSTFTVPPSASTYDITLRIMRDNGMANFVFAFDEIKIYDASCGNIDSYTIVEPTTTVPGTLITAITAVTTDKITTFNKITPDTTTLPTIPVSDPTAITSAASDTTSTHKSSPITSEQSDTTALPDVTTTRYVAPDTTTTTATSAKTTATSTTTTATSATTTATSAKTTATSTTTTATSTTTSSTTTTATITQYLRRLFYCDFSTAICFQDTDIIVTNGTEVPLLDLSQPPRAPLSDATSV
ncbi:unnamed protein product, partial [Adineta ricciae]